ncbi:MAG TPA: substrate-binding domain-containing protein, partial [Burkholderiales bacterium]|nr:substrate-binding domain-containing protein [Burkholderiales bacterium]
MKHAPWNACAFALLCFVAFEAGAAEIRACGARATSTILGEIGPEFERTTGHRIKVSIDVAAAVARRFDAGEPCDLLVVLEGQLDGLVKSGKIIAASRTVLARSGIGVEVRAGAPRPDIGSVEAFKRALLDAKSIAYLKEGG